MGLRTPDGKCRELRDEQNNSYLPTKGGLVLPIEIPQKGKDLWDIATNTSHSCQKQMGTHPTRTAASVCVWTLQ